MPNNHLNRTLDIVVTHGMLEQPQFAGAQALRGAARPLRDAMRTDAGRLAKELEEYVVSGADNHGGLPSSSVNTTKVRQKDQLRVARDVIFNGLIDALREKNIPKHKIPRSMNYKSYQTKIVGQREVVLVGFPGDQGVVNPGKLDADMLMELLRRLHDGRCHWQALAKSTSSSISRNPHMAYPRGTSSDSSCYEVGTHFPGGSFFSQTSTPGSSDASHSPRYLPETPPAAGTPQDNDDLAVNDYEEVGDTYYAFAQLPPAPEPMNWQPDHSLSQAMDVFQNDYFNACLSLPGNGHNPNFPPLSLLTAPPYPHSQFPSLCQPQPIHHPHMTLHSMPNNYANNPQTCDNFAYWPTPTHGTEIDLHLRTQASPTEFTIWLPNANLR